MILLHVSGKTEIILLLSLNLLFILDLKAQNLPKEYVEYVKKADSLYNLKNYKASADYYSRAFAANNNKGLYLDRYNGACSWSLSNNKDSAFFNLYRIAETGNYSNYNQITSDQDLISLHADPRWDILIKMVQKNKEKAELNLNRSLVRELDDIFQKDQKYRNSINELIKIGGDNTAQIQILNDSMRINDNINVKKVIAILDQYGWVGDDVVGEQGSLTIFLVIQHADIKIQEKYLPLMDKAVKDGKASAANLALLQDRVALTNGKEQIFGTQVIRDPKTGIYTVAPIYDEINVDKRRDSVGLESLASYLKRYGIDYMPSKKK
jgi:hypothetical protein